MSLPSSPDFLFRADSPNLPLSDDCNIFDQVLNHKLYEVDDDNADGGLGDSPNEQDYFANEPTLEDYPRLPSLCGSTTLDTSNDQPTPQPWRKGLWCLNHNTLKIEKTRKTGVGTMSGAQLFNDQEFTIQSPTSPFVRATKPWTMRFVTSPNAAKYLHKGTTYLPLSREATLSPSPMYGQLPLRAKMQQVKTWQQDFKNFSIHNSQLRSDEPSLMTLAHDQNNRISHFNNTTVANNAAYQPCQLPSTAMYHDEDTEQVIDPGLIHCDESDLMAQTQLPQTAQPRITMAPNTVHQGYGLTWTTESLDSSNGSNQSSYDTLPPSLSSGISSNGVHTLGMNQSQQMWWPQDMTPTTPAWSTTAGETTPGITAPTPKRAATHSYVENMTDRAEGLGIQYPDFHSTDLYDSSLFFTTIKPRTPTTAYSPKRAQPMSHGIPPVPPLPFPIPHNSILHNTSPSNTPHTTRHSPNRPQSPPLSPLSINPRTSRRHNRSPSRPEHTHHRRKSIHKPGPIKSGLLVSAIDEPLPSATSQNSTTTTITHHPSSTTTSATRSRSRSHSKTPRTPRTPKTASGTTSSFHNPPPSHAHAQPATTTTAFGAIDFVNFTAKDSAKLLSDVAPSGSSKTRARRDAEAREKRKKLSEAALRAVSSVGGDVEALRRAIVG